MIPRSAYLSEFLHHLLTSAPHQGIQIWSSVFDYHLQIGDFNSCNQLLRELRRLDINTEIGASAYILQKTGKGTLAAHMGDWETSIRLYVELLSNSTEENSGWLFVNLGNVYYLSRHYDKALQSYEKALEVYRKTNDQHGQAKALINLGSVYRDSGNIQKAIEMFKSSSKIIPENDIETIVINLTNWANVLQIAREMEEAKEKYNQALRLLERLNAPHLKAQTMGNLGTLYMDLGEIEKSIDYFIKDLTIQQELGNHASQSETLNNLGMAYRRKGIIEQALHCYEQSAQIKTNLGDKVGELSTLCNYCIAAKEHAKTIPVEILTRAVQLAVDVDDDETFKWLKNITPKDDEAH